MDKAKLMTDLAQALSSQNTPQLEALAKQAVENFPNDAFGYSYLAEYFLVQDPPIFSKAEVCLVKSIEFDNTNADYLVRFGDIKEKQGLYEDARVLYLKALSLDENQVDALVNLGRYQIHIAKLYDKAIEYLQKAVGISPEHRMANLSLAEAYLHSNNLSEALVSISKILGGEFDEETTLVLIQILDALHDKKQLIKIYDMLVMKRPDNPQYRFEFGRHLYDAKIYSETVVQIQKGLELIGEEVDAVFSEPMLKSLFVLQRYEELLSLINPLIEKEPDNLELHALRANTYFEQKNLEAALSDYDKIIEIVDDPINGFEYYKLKAYLLLRMNRKAEAIKIFEQMMDNDFTEKEGLYNMGMIQFGEKNMSEAYTLLKKAKLKGHVEAEKAIYEKLVDYLDEVRTKLLATNAPEIAKNGQSVFMNKIFGKLWIFDRIESTALKSVSEAIVTSIKKSLASFTLFFTEKGGLMVKAIQADGLAYKILAETENTTQLQLILLDGSKTMTVTLALNGAELSFSEKEGEVLFFKVQDLGNIPTTVEDAYLRTLIPEEMEFLGDKATALISTFFQEA